MIQIISNGGIAVVTGAALGIGRASVKRFATAGMSVAAVDVDQAGLATLCDDIAQTGGPGSVLPVVADLGAPGAVAGMVSTVLAELGTPSLLMNNAVTRLGRGQDADIDDWRTAFEVNFWALVETCRAFLPEMAKAGGIIVNVGSKQGITNPPGHPIYNIAKAAVKTYTEGLEHDLRGRDGPRVSAHLLIPGWTTTGTAQPKPGAWMPDQVVDFMVAGLERGDFYILCPDDETTTDMDHRRILWGAADITENRPPLSRWHPDWAERAKEACN